MSGNLTFKLVLEGDNSSLISATKQSESTTKAVFDTIKEEANQLKQSSQETAQEVGKVIPDDLGQKADIAKQAVGDVAHSTDALGQTSSNASSAVTQFGQNLSAIADDSSHASSSLNDVSNELKATSSSAQKTQQSLDQVDSKIDDLTNSSEQASTQIGQVIPEGTNELAKNLTDSLNQASIMIQQSGENASNTSKNFTEFGNVSSKALDRLKLDLETAKHKLQEFSQTKASPADIEIAKQQVDQLEQEVKQADQAFGGFKEAVNKANTDIKNTEQIAKQTEDSIKDLKGGFEVLTKTLAALGIGVTAKEIANTADEFKNLTAILKNAIGEHGNLEVAMENVIKVALKTNTSLESTVNLYSKLIKSGKEFKISQNDALTLTETINKAIKVSGSAADSAEAALFQLNQAIGSGVLRGEEFNSVLEQSPRLAQALADGLGVTIGKLREMAAAGQLTTSTITQALLSQSSTISSEFEKFPLTIGNSIENIKTSWMIYLGELDKTHGISEKVAQAISYISSNLDQLSSTLAFVAKGFIAYKALGIAAVFLEKANSVKTASLALQQETVEIVANTQAQIANASAAKENAKAHTNINSSVGGLVPTFSRAASGLTGLVSRLGAYGAAAAGVIVAGKMLYDTLEDIGKASGEAAAKFWLYVTGQKSLEESEKELAEQEEKTKQKILETEEAKRRDAAAAELAKNASLGLNEVSKQTVIEFDKQVKAGERVEIVLNNVAKSFNFDSTTGINNGITALLALEAQGKASHDQIRKALSGLLTGEDLITFQTNASVISSNIKVEMGKLYLELQAKKLAYEKWKLESDNLSYDEWKVQNQKLKDGINQTEAQIAALETQQKNSVTGMALVQESTLDQAIIRTGLSYEELQGKSTEAFRIARNDVDILVQNLEVLKGKGVDVGQALDLSISKAINTSTNQQEIESLKAKILSLRSVLGEQVTDGLLQQAELQLIKLKQKSDEAKSGINSVEEAFAKFGIQSKAQANQIADDYINAFKILQSSGQASAEQTKQALIAMADEIYASGNAAKISWYEAQLSANNLKSTVDEAGKASVSAMNQLEESVYRVRDATGSAKQGFKELGQTARDEALSSTEAWNKAMEAQSGGIHQATSGSRAKMSFNTDDIVQKLKDMGYGDDRAADIAKQIYSGSQLGNGYRNASMEWLTKMGYDPQSTKVYGNANYVNEALEKYQQYVKHQSATMGIPTTSNTSSASSDSTATSNQSSNSSNSSQSTSSSQSSSTSASNKTVTFVFQYQNKTAELQGTESAGMTLESMLKELELIKKSS